MKKVYENPELNFVVLSVVDATNDVVTGQDDIITSIGETNGGGVGGLLQNFN